MKNHEVRKSFVLYGIEYLQKIKVMNCQTTVVNSTRSYIGVGKVIPPCILDNFLSKVRIFDSVLLLTVLAKWTQELLVFYYSNLCTQAVGGPGGIGPPVDK